MNSGTADDRVGQGLIDPTHVEGCTDGEDRNGLGHSVSVYHRSNGTTRGCTTHTLLFPDVILLCQVFQSILFLSLIVIRDTHDDVVVISKKSAT